MLPILSFGQKDYQNGYIITNNNDTLMGHVKDRKSPPYGKIYKKIRFKNSNIIKRKYGPHQIIGYKQGVNQFESLWIDVSHDFFQEKYTSIPNSGKKYFLKVIVKGYLTYYQWEFKEQESDYIWKKSLVVYFQDCPELVYKIENEELNDPVEIAKFYNRWKVYNP